MRHIFEKKKAIRLKAVNFSLHLIKDQMTKTDLFYLADRSIALNTSVPN